MIGEECCYSHTAQSLEHSLPRAVSGSCQMERCSPWPAPFSPQAPPKIALLCSSGSSSVRVRPVALHLRGPRASLPFGPRRSRGLPVLVHVVSQRARVLRLRRTDCSLASIASSRGAFLHQERVGILVLRFSKLHSPAHRYPCLRFKQHLAMSSARLRAKMESLSPFS
jgi:hypothetical protein